MNKSTILTAALIIAVLSASSPARADTDPEVSASAPRTPIAVETNVLWPFFPGGISELKLLVPVRGFGSDRTEFVAGLHSDFMQRQRLEMGKVNILALKLGVRQYLWRGFHADVTANFGWRMEHERPSTGRDHDDFIVSTWGLAGYQLDLGTRWYVNSRAGLGYIAYRSGSWPGEREGVFFASDINLGVYF